jgi:hypothetical protein
MKLFWTAILLLVASAVAYLLAATPTTTPRTTTPPPILDTPIASLDPAPPASATPLEPASYPNPDSLTDALISGDWSAVPITPSKPPTEPNYSIAKATITRQPDGSLLVDNRQTIKGSGTDANPYEITWDLLTAAEHTFNPRTGTKKIPEGVALLDGKRVRIAANVAFPLYVETPTEFLAMLNQWDGCCIGVPPTPYDAIEVHLAKPISGNDRFASSGTIEGTFAVKPYISGTWLVGLYVLNHATLNPGEAGPSPTRHNQ